jgi:hypothetical protein
LLKIGGKVSVECLLCIIELKANKCYENQPTIQQVKREKRSRTNLWKKLTHILVNKGADHVKS